MERLEEYRRKRDFARTPEPAGEAPGASVSGASGDLYVMHKHAASHDHFDLRLERDGVLKSWALPKGPSLEPGEKRLAVEVEDHPLDYADFEGVIPAKAYGGGTVMLWDRGTWRIEGRAKKDRIDIELDGERLKGRWTLTRMRGKSQDRRGRNWLMIKRHDDEPRMDPALDVDEDSSIASGRSMAQIAADRDAVWSADEGKAGTPPDPSQLDGAKRAKLPREFQPQLATLAREVPARGDWLYEIKLDGYRLLARIQSGEVRLLTRNGKDWSGRFPELAKALQALPVKSALLDGEVVAMGRDGISRFGLLQEALAGGHTAHLLYQVFDLPYLDGYDLAAVALRERKRALQALLAAAGPRGSVRYSDHMHTRGADFYRRACQLGLEGIICKRADGHYQQKRSRDWLKIKCIAQEEFVVGGYTEPGGARTGFGALLIGAYGDEGEENLVYAGRVGSGFSQRQLEQLSGTLRALETDRPPFCGSVPDSRAAHWVRPELVIEVEFSERTRDGRPRHPVFRGLREDRNPREIRLTAAKKSAAEPEPAPRRRAVLGRRRGEKGETSLLGVRLTHPGRVLFPELGLTKLELARFYQHIQDWVLPQLARRPLALLRCPEGRGGECFFQKHPRGAIPDSVPRVQVPEKNGSADYVYIESAADMIGLVQAGALEIHPWGSRIDHLEQPDLLVFDLDPGEGVAWRELLRVARSLRERLESLGLTPFPRTTGGKGLHLVVPLVPDADWDNAKAFARAIAEQQAREEPERVTAKLSKARREGRVFIDYLRNGRGATAVASYTVRARKNAPLAVPVRWDELSPALRADRYNVGNLRRRLAALRGDPWSGFADAARPLDAGLLEKMGVK